MRYATTACLVLLLVLFAVSGCATPEPVAAKAPVARPQIPDDLIPVCYKGKLGVISESAQQGMAWNLPCLDEKQVSR